MVPVKEGPGVCREAGVLLRDDRTTAAKLAERAWPGPAREDAVRTGE